MRHALLLLLAAIAPFGIHAAEKTPDFVPLPAKVEITEGRFKLTPDTLIVAPAALANEAGFLAKHLRAVAGLPAPVVASGQGVALAIDVSLPAEGYAMEISPGGVRIRGGSPAGVFYGVQTFMQALPPAVLGYAGARKADWSAPCLVVQDSPAMAWRGLMLDSSRHFQPKAFILKFLDAMAAHKLNRFHWHLVDAQAWRLEIKKYPKLTQVTKDAPAYYTEEIPTNPTSPSSYRYGDLHGGGFYTQEDVREIVAHAAARHIVVIPEIEFPAHSRAALSAYPEFSTTRRSPEETGNKWGCLFGVHPEALTFLKEVLDETTNLFPGPWIHFGGDEAPKDEWRANAGVQAKIDSLGLRSKNDSKTVHASEDALQAWLFNEMAAHVGKHGKRAVGWEEIMHGDNIHRLAKGSVIMPWLSVDNAVKSANSGYGVVFTKENPFYLDSRQSGGPGEPSTHCKGVYSAQSILGYDLLPAGLTPEGRANILGAQCQLWTEEMPRTDDVEYQAFPRACALAELTWTAPERRADTNGFMARLVTHGDRLSALGLNHRRVSPTAQVGWSPAIIASGRPWEFAVPPALAVRVASGETLSVQFNYKSGGHGIDLAGVELLADGKVVASSRHKGFAGGSSRDTAYKLDAPGGVKAEKLTLRVDVKGSGGSDSAGEAVLETVR